MILPWIGALLVGLSLGILGSGGSILTVPILIYLVGEQGKVAIAESLAIVGAISLAAFIPYAYNKQVHWESVILFGIPSMGGAYLGAFVSIYISANAQLIIFAGVMLLAAVMMFRNSRSGNGPKSVEVVWWFLGLQGLLIGVLTGLVGVGGGFMIVPALVLLSGLSIDLAVGTSLIIITMKSLVGFIKYLDVLEKLNFNVDIRLMIIFALIGAVGSLVGKKVGAKISSKGLKQAFAVFLVVMGGYVTYMNF